MSFNAVTAILMKLAFNAWLAATYYAYPGASPRIFE